MLENPIHITDLQAYHSNARVVELVKQQLIKDCHPFIDLHAIADEQFEYKSLLNFLSDSFEDLDRRDHSGLLSIIYRIDLDKTQYQSCIELAMNYNCLALKVLNRVFMKVLFRLYYEQLG